MDDARKLLVDHVSERANATGRRSFPSATSNRPASLCNTHRPVLRMVCKGRIGKHVKSMKGGGNAHDSSTIRGSYSRDLVLIRRQRPSQASKHRESRGRRKREPLFGGLFAVRACDWRLGTSLFGWWEKTNKERGRKKEEDRAERMSRVDDDGDRVYEKLVAFWRYFSQ